MNTFEQAVKTALESSGEEKFANRAYLEFIKANFFIPIEKQPAGEAEALFLAEGEEVWLPVFSSQDHLDHWAAPIQEHIQILHLSGVNLLKGLGEGVSVAMNIGSEFSKVFLPAELARMKSMVLKLFQ